MAVRVRDLEIQEIGAGQGDRPTPLRLVGACDRGTGDRVDSTSIETEDVHRSDGELDARRSRAGQQPLAGSPRDLVGDICELGCGARVAQGVALSRWALTASRNPAA